MKRDFAFYYPGQYWHDSDWMKNLILFFDGISMLIPEYMEDHGSFDDYAIVSALKKQGLFNIMRPEVAVGAKETEALSRALTDIVSSGGLDHLVQTTSKDRAGSSFGSISMSRLGYRGSEELAEAIFHQLKERGLTRDSDDGVSIPMHRTVRTLILILLSQILRGQGEEMGVTLSPVTDRWDLVFALNEIISVPAGPPGVGEIVSFDLAMVGVDLSSVPIDEILDFRQQNYAAHRDYRLSILKFSHELSSLGAKDREAAFEQRQEELDVKAQALRRVNWKAWKKPATFALSVASAVRLVESGNPTWAALAILLAVLGLIPEGSKEGNVYSYLMSAQRKWSV